MYIYIICMYITSLQSQPPRTHDLSDINALRDAKLGVDSNYKVKLWELGQGVERQGNVPHGICPCLVPTMISLIAMRGGGVTGREALALQGMPIDR
jgi:hypothetical protein